MSFRIGATVLIDYYGNAIQSYNFNTKRILGNLQKVLEFLDAYEIDEIHAIVPSKGRSDNDSSEVFSNLSDISISTPLGIGGGITEKNIKEITRDPFFERCIFNSAIFNNSQLLKKTKAIMGRQSMVASMPFIIKNDTLMIYNSESDKFEEVDSELRKEINKNFNEIILLDADAEGSKKGFDFEVFKHIEFPIDRVLISGGLTKDDISKARKMGLAGVTIDNFVLHSEYSIRGLR
jgi:imidazole glycerol phosphate synthase subunit HisF